MTKEILERCPLFQGLEEGELEYLAGLSRERHFPAGALIFREDEPGTTLYVLLEGEVRITKRNFAGKALELAVLHPADFFGEMSILDEEVRSASAEAVTPCRLLVIEKEAMEAVIQRQPKLIHKMALILVRRLRRADDKISTMERLQTIQEQILEAQNEERKRIAQNIHDGAAQTIAAAYMGLSLLKQERGKWEEDLARVERLCERAARQLRQSIFNLHPKVLEEEGFHAALATYLKEVREDYGVRAVREGEAPALSLKQGQVVLAVVQEAVMNSVKHSGTKEIQVSLGGDKRVFRLQVSDRGRGFDLSDVEEKLRRERHLGLFSMRERIKWMGGRLDIRSQRGEGTTVSIELHLEQEGRA